MPTPSQEQVLVINKLDAATRNLTTAIHLFFEYGDEVAVHTLAGAAQQILRDLAKSKSRTFAGLLHDHPAIPSNRKGKWITILNEARNFFKHADKDPDGTVTFQPLLNELLLLDSIVLLIQLSPKPLVEANVYAAWFALSYPDSRNAFGANDAYDHCIAESVLPSNKLAFRELCR